MKTLRPARALVALALCALPASAARPAAADPVVPICLSVATACVVADAGLCADGAVCAEPRVVAAACLRGGEVVSDVCVHTDTSGGIERPATGTITISGSMSGPTSVVYTGVFDQSLGLFSCTLTTPGERTVRCVPTSNSYDWYCAGWVVTATAAPFVTYNSQVAGKASCSDHQGFPTGSPYQTLYTDFAFSGQTKTAQAAGLSWFVQNAITCEAWGYSAGPEPMGDYTVTCDEPGANAPR